MRSIVSVVTVLTLSLSAGLAGCIGASIDGGEIDGTPFAPASAFHFELNDAVVVFISNHPDPCTRYQQDDSRVADLDALTIVLSDIRINNVIDVDIDDVEPGTYPVRLPGNGRNSGVTFEVTDDDCEVEELITADEGDVELLDYDPKGVAAGTFEVEMDGDDVVGNFRAAFCDIDDDDIDRDQGDCDP